jgi:hypothetical protein
VSLTQRLLSLTFSDPDAGDSHTASQWQITTIPGDYSSSVFDSGADDANLTSIIVPPLDCATTYYWHVRYRDNHGAWSGWSTQTSFTTVSAPNQAPGQPSNVSPVDGATDISRTPSLQSSAFSDPDAEDTPATSQWQITIIPGDYSSPVFDSGADYANLTSIIVPPLDYSTTYYWHVRYQDNHGAWSSWSTETTFTTFAPPNQAPDQPTNLSPPDASAGISLTPTLQSSAFSDSDGADIHAASQWRITTTAGNYSSPVFDSGADDANLTGVIVPPLDYSTTYYWQVRHRDDHGDWSSWSAETSFTTIAASQGHSGLPSWIWILIGAAAVLIVGALSYFVRIRGAGQ